MKFKGLDYRKDMIKRIVMFVMCVGFITAAVIPMYGFNPNGPKIKIHLKNGATLVGELENVLGKKLILLNRDTGKEKEIIIDDINRLILVKRIKISSGSLNGALFGFTVGFFHKKGEDGNKNAYLLTVPAGGMIGALSSFALAGKSKSYDINRMTSPEIESLLNHLRVISQSNVNPDPKIEYNKGLLGRFRILWRPYTKIGKDLDLDDKLILSTTTLPEEQLVIPKYFNANLGENQGLLGRIRIDYALREWVSVGVEFCPAGDNDFSGFGNFRLSNGDKNYNASTIIKGIQSTNIAMLQLNIGLKNATGLLKALRLETGAGLSFSSIKFTEPEYKMNFSPTPTYSGRSVKPAFEIGLSAELNPNDVFTSGVFLSYLYAPVSIPAMEWNGTAQFHELNLYGGEYSEISFVRDAQIKLEKISYNTGGFSLGFFMRFR